MADKAKAGAKKLSPEEKMKLYKKVEIPVQGSKEKITNYDEQDVEIVALDGCKHMKAGEKYPVQSSTAVVLIEKGWAKVVE